MKKRYDEQIVQTFPYRCPYCEEPVAYDHLDLKPGENPIQCPSCHRMFIRLRRRPRLRAVTRIEKRPRIALWRAGTAKAVEECVTPDGNFPA